MASKKRSAKKTNDSPGELGELGELARMMRGIDFCMMSTVSKGGLRTRPMSNNGEVDFDGDAWFFSWRNSQKVRDLAKDPQVALAYEGGKKSAPIWIAIQGKGVIIDDEDRKKELWIKDLDRWFDKGPEDPRVVLIRVRAARAAWWSYEGEGEMKIEAVKKASRRRG